jgi:hypothetical protein
LIIKVERTICVCMCRFFALIYIGALITHTKAIEKSGEQT